MSVPHREHMTSPLLAHQVNMIYTFVTMVQKYNSRNPGHYPLSFYLKKFFGNWILSSNITYSAGHKRQA
jgi:hypothetical protein